MSVLRGRPEVIGARSERRFCPIAAERHSGAKCEDDDGQVRGIPEPAGGDGGSVGRRGSRAAGGEQTRIRGQLAAMRLLSVAGYVIVDEMREDDDQFRFRSRGSQLRAYRCSH
jgi:hypothetical protein